MSTSNLIKLAPTLSAEERFRIVVTDLHKELAGGQAVLSASERQAVIRCENRAEWEDYTRHIGIMQWAGEFWVRGIETDKLRVLASYYILSRTVDGLVIAALMKLPDKAWDQRLADVRDDVAFFEQSCVTFYAFREAIAQIERGEIYGMPLFDEKKEAIIADYYVAVDELFESYNGRMKALSEAGIMKAYLKTVREHMESYMAKRPIPGQQIIDTLISEVMGVVDSEMAMLGS